MRKHLSPGVVLASIAIVLASTGSAAAGALITSAKIKDGTIQNKDIKKGTIALNRLTPAAQKAVRLAAKPGATGVAGATGATGATGAPGAAGTTLQASPGAAPLANWGLINRNTEGTGTAFLREGPAKPAYGTGSLNLLVGSPDQKVAFGNEDPTDAASIADGTFDNVTKVGYRVYTTGENNTRPSANVPTITFEVDPNMESVDATLPKPANYTSLVFTPESNSPDNAWSGYIDATTSGKWGMTGAAFKNGTCGNDGGRCTFAQLKAFLNDGGASPKILSLAVGKGKDYAFQGAVDGLRLNDTVFDFESDGVFATTP
jgi:hypothetical protein